MALPETPHGWGDDKLTDFFDKSRQNTYWHFVHNRENYDRLRNINEAFYLICSNLAHPPDWFIALFFLRTHSSFMGAVRLALASQVPESYMVMRGCLENALYAFYLQRDPTSHQRWLERHSSPAALKVVRNEFRPSRMIEDLTTADLRLGEAVETLYDRTIDYGAHPNERAVTQMSKFSEDEDTRRIDMAYLISPEKKPAVAAVKSTAQTGVAALKVLRHAMRERFDLLGVTEKIGQLEQGL